MAKNDITRRDFIKGMAAGAVGVASMGVLSGCDYRFLGVPDPVAQEAAAKAAAAEEAIAAAAANASTVYTPGTYSASAKGIASDVKVTMTFDEHSITNVEIDVSGETPDIGGKIGPDMENAILVAQGADVDAVSGASVTSEAIRQAAADCISQASGSEVVLAAKEENTADADWLGQAPEISESDITEELETEVEDIGDVVEAGQCGESVYYVRYSNGRVLLKGTGAMYDYGTAIPVSDCRYPDVDGSGKVNASDASAILEAAANIGAGRPSGLTPEQELLADADCDGYITASDASLVLSFAASAGVGLYDNDLTGWTNFLNDQNANRNRSPFFDNQDIRTLVVSDGITTLGTFAFTYCSNLASASLPNTLTKIGRNAFASLATDVYGLTAISIPSGVTEIGQYAFANTQITSLTIPHLVATVGTHVCNKCTDLTTVRYEGAIIGAYMFFGCTALTNFTIAVTCTEISTHCFSYCSSLTSITYEGSLDDWAAVTKQNNWDGHSNQIETPLTRIQCLDGYMEWDSENREWIEVGE
mgnify:CR=1 FL=1